MRLPDLDPTALNLYLNFLVKVVMPTGNSADHFYFKYREAIDATATALRNLLGVSEHTLYRGLLLDPADAEDGVISPVSRIAYMSFSDDVNVARKFADINDPMSAYVKMLNPHYRGYLISYAAPRDEILFHHAWADPLRLHQLGVPGWDAVLVRSQKEVIVRQTGLHFLATPSFDVSIAVAA